MIRNIILLMLVVLLITANKGRCEIGILHQKVDLITRDASNYRTPENTLAAIHSALIAGMLEWADEGMTREALAEDISDFKMAGIDRSRLFELERTIREEYIVDRIEYKDAILLVVEVFGYSGSFQRIPLAFVLEDGLWKFTNKFSSDEFVLGYLRYVPPLFDGKGQNPAEVNSLLGYEQPTQAQTDLPAGTVNYTVHIYYGKTVVPATFSATLNREDISTKFSPEPFTDEEVAISLKQGRNVLLLSVDGEKANGKTATDTDRLVFVVP